ncbi:hypothetical protein MMC28_003176 [Mycoblastus sanguinarius]|nr:hypothetical protein [Mycoblastus sanguinarius]
MHHDTVCSQLPTIFLPNTQFKIQCYVTHTPRRPLIFRVSGLPNGPPREIKSLLAAAIKQQCCTEKTYPNFEITPLPSCYSQQSESSAALLRFETGTPEFLTDIVVDPLDSVHVQVEDAGAANASITIDRHFHGFTQLYHTDGSQEIAADIIAITGMDAHAYGSWMSKDDPNKMWLRDFLSKDLPDCRTMIYGYHSKLSTWNMNQLSEYGREFFAEITKVRFSEEDQRRPLFLIAHSYGGIVLAHCLVRAFRAADKMKESIHRSTYGILFFGTPHRGSVKESLMRMVEQPGNPRQLMLLQTEAGPDLLRIQLDDFANTVEDRKIESFYETEMTPSPELGPEGKWVRTGPPMLQVSESSSILQLPNHVERKYPVNANHSNMIKFKSPDDPTYTTVLKILREYKRDAQSVVSHRHLQLPLMPISKFTVPFRRDVHFVGRQDILERLRVILQSPGYHNRAALVGLGGIGKSQIAIEYAWRLKHRSPHTSVFWVHASSVARFNHSYHEIADSLNIPDHDLPNVDILPLVFTYLSEQANGQWLMILDNTEDFGAFTGTGSQSTEAKPRHLASLLPEVTHGSILITSRNKHAAETLVGGISNVLEVPPMSDSHTLTLLRARSGDSQSLEVDCKTLVSRLGNIPLAVTQAAAFISQKGSRMSISRYLKLFSESSKTQTFLLGDDLGDLRRDPGVANALLTTWQISFDQLRERNPGSAELLAVMSYLDPQVMPESLFLSKYGKDFLQFENLVAPLTSYSFITNEIGGVSFGMHHLVQLATKEWLREHGQEERYKHEAMDLIVNAFPDASDLFQHWATCEAMSPHAEAVLQQPPTSMTIQQTLAMATLLYNTACYAELRGDFNTAFVKSVSARDIQFQLFGWGDPRIVQTSNLITNLLSEMGRREVAIRVQRTALERRAASLGPNHRKTNMSLRMMGQLGELLREQNRLEEAKVIAGLAVEGLTKVSGAGDLHTLSAMRTVALIHHQEGYGKQAEATLKHVLEARREKLGIKHLDTLTSMGDLADFYTSYHYYDRALPLFASVCTSIEQAFGPNHRKSVDVLGRYARASAGSRHWKNNVLAGRLARLIARASRLPKRLASPLFHVVCALFYASLCWLLVRFEQFVNETGEPIDGQEQRAAPKGKPPEVSHELRFS